MQDKIEAKLRSYGPTADPLILEVDVYNRGGFDVEIDGHDPLFGTNGVWSRKRSSPAAVLFVTETSLWAVPGTQACLYVTPSVGPSVLPPALLRIPRAQGKDCFKRIEGESIASILGIS